MTTQQIHEKIQKDFDINAIFAQHVLNYTKGKFDLEQIKKNINEKAKPFVGGAVFFDFV